MSKYHTRGLLLVDNEFHDSDYVWSQDLWDALVKEYGTLARKTEDGLSICVIPEEAAVREQSRWMSTCLYRATEEYVLRNFGVRFSKADEDMFHAHPLTEPPGTPQPYTARVISDLVNQYGLVISHARMIPGRALTGDLEQWPKVLGTNPIGFADRQTDNLDFARMTGMGLAEADKQFRFEFTQEPLRPAICCGYMHKMDANGAGHAEYNGGNERMNDLFVLQFQVDRKERVQYVQEPVFPALPKKQSHYRLSPWKTKGKDGKEINVPRTPFFPVYTTGHAKQRSWQEYPGPAGKGCTICLNKKLNKNEMVGAGLCIRCWAVFTSLFRCAVCGEPIGGKMDSNDVAPFIGLSKNDNEQEWRIGTACTNCKLVLRLRALPGTAAWAVVAALRGEDGVAALYATTKTKERV